MSLHNPRSDAQIVQPAGYVTLTIGGEGASVHKLEIYPSEPKTTFNANRTKFRTVRAMFVLTADWGVTLHHGSIIGI